MKERDMTLRIALVAPLSPPSGGIATWTEGMLAFTRQDFETELVLVDTAVRYGSLGKLRSNTRSALAMRILCGPFAAASIVVRFALALLWRRCRVAHICTSASLGMLRDLVMVAFARLLHVRVVLHMHLGWVPRIMASHNWEASLIARTSRLAGRVIVLDEASAECLRAAVSGCDVVVIPNPAWNCAGIEMTVPDTACDRTIVFVGHVVPSKGVRELVKACAGIPEASLRLQLIGPVEPAFRAELFELAQAKAAGDWIEIAGPLGNQEATRRVRSALALALPSHWEGFPYVVLEAMMCGKPVISTPVGAVSSMLAVNESEPCGICVPVGEVDSLRRAIERLLRNPAYAHELGRRGRERVLREYSPASVYTKYQEAWNGTSGASAAMLAEQG
jgi:glycosyltransferase involved in cell wall biosynthesis